MKRPSRRLRESATTTLKKGRFLAPPRANLITTIAGVPPIAKRSIVQRNDVVLQAAYGWASGGLPRVLRRGGPMCRRVETDGSAVISRWPARASPPLMPCTSSHALRWFAVKSLPLGGVDDNFAAADHSARPATTRRAID